AVSELPVNPQAEAVTATSEPEVAPASQQSWRDLVAEPAASDDIATAPVSPPIDSAVSAPAPSLQGFARFDRLIEDDHGSGRDVASVRNRSDDSDEKPAIALPVSAPEAVVAQLPDATISPAAPSQESATQLPMP